DYSILQGESINKICKFVIQKHSRSDQTAHWDLMLETGPSLETYRLTLPPEKLVGQTCSAVRISDHPLKFLTYQGPVNNAAAQVQIADNGTCKILSSDRKHKTLQFKGNILKGKFTITHITEDQWQLGKTS
ncbi:MAG: DNA polymerase ligase N-terminal domain-containing protein, partial [Planctomycetota bacterium]